MDNLLGMIKDQLSDVVVDRISDLVGLDRSNTTSAVGNLLPGLLAGVINRGSDEGGSGMLMDLISNNDLGEGVLDNFTDILGGGERSSNFMNMGLDLLSSIFGGRDSSMLGQLASLAGLGREKSNGLLSILAPLALSQIGKLVKSKGFNAGGLMSFLLGQKDHVKAALPAGFAAFSDMGDKAEEVVRTAAAASDDNNSGGGGLGVLKWLIPLLAVALLAWYLMKGCGDDQAAGHGDDHTEQVDAHQDGDGHSHDGDGHKHADGTAHDGHDHDGHDHDGDDAGKKMTQTYRLDKDGNVVDQYGFIVYPFAQVKRDQKGNVLDANGRIIIPLDQVSKLTLKTAGKKSPKLSVDKDGNLVDADGKIVLKKGEFSEVDGYYVDKEGNRLGFLSKIGKAIGDAAEATAEVFKTAFSGLFSKKVAGSTKEISRMEFNKENHRLTYFNKAEFEGLVAALKANPNSKIQVRVHTNDGQNDKDNKKLSDLRANVVRDMMVTLGIDKKQITFKGMGSENAAKAAKDAVEVYVEG